jgi:hypothetical protein
LKKWLAISIFVCAALMLPSCGVGISQTTPAATLSPSIPASFAELVVSPAATASPATSAIPSVPYFPVRKKASDQFLDGLIRGQLVIENNCVRVKSIHLPNEPQFANSPESSSLIIWPYGYSLDTSGEKPQVLDEKQQPIAVIGDFFYAGGGGDYPRSFVEAAISQNLPVWVQGPFWIASNWSHPAELSYNIPIHDGIDVQPDSTKVSLEGILILDRGMDKGLLRLATDSANSELLIWPPGTYCEIKDYAVQVMDRDGKPLAKVGDKLAITGVEIPDYMLPHYTREAFPFAGGPFLIILNLINKTTAP